MDRLMTLVRSKDGIETIIKGLDGKLSEAIMYAMENGPDLEKKVSQLDIFLYSFPFYPHFLTIWDQQIETFLCFFLEHN